MDFGDESELNILLDTALPIKVSYSYWQSVVPIKGYANKYY